jgi:septal ring factor EnvC (AmiA/AmiB activator)
VSLLVILIQANLAFCAPNVQQMYETTRSQFDKDERDHREVLGTLYLINKKMKLMSKKRSDLTDRMLSVRGNAQDIALLIKQLEKKMNIQRRLLSRRLSALYRMNLQAPLRLIFSSASTTDLDRNLRFLKKIANRDIELIRDYTMDLQTLRKNREKLKDQVFQLSHIQQQLKNQESLLLSEQRSKAQVLEKLSDHQKLVMDRLKRIRSQEPVVFETPFFEKKGDLILPAAGVVIRDYGLIEHPDLHYRLAHKGIFVKTTAQTEVRSVHQGRVVYKGFVPGHGWTVIVNHGDHYHTVYASLSDTKVEVDDMVQENQIIARTGFSDFYQQTGLYFEIRHFTDAIDPAPWIKENQNKRVSQADSI